MKKDRSGSTFRFGNSNSDLLASLVTENSKGPRNCGNSITIPVENIKSREGLMDIEVDKAFGVYGKGQDQLDIKVFFDGTNRKRSEVGLDNTDRLLVACLVEEAKKRGSHTLNIKTEELYRLLLDRNILKKGDKNRGRIFQTIINRIYEIQHQSVFIRETQENPEVYWEWLRAPIYTAKELISNGEIVGVLVNVDTWINLNIAEKEAIYCTLEASESVPLCFLVAQILKRYGKAIRGGKEHHLTFEYLAKKEGWTKTLKREADKAKKVLSTRLEGAFKLQSDHSKHQYRLERTEKGYKIIALEIH